MSCAAKVASCRGSRRQKGQPHGRGFKSERDGKVGVILYFNWMGNSLLRGAAKIVAQPGGDVPHPGGDHFLDATGADDLIELHVRDRRNQNEIFLFLPDDFVSGGKWDQGRSEE